MLIVIKTFYCSNLYRWRPRVTAWKSRRSRLLDSILRVASWGRPARPAAEEDEEEEEEEKEKEEEKEEGAAVKERLECYPHGSWRCCLRSSHGCPA